MTLTDVEIRALNAMRRSSGASALRAVATRAAKEARERYETTPATEENRLQSVAANAVIVALFTKDL